MPKISKKMSKKRGFTPRRKLKRENKRLKNFRGIIFSCNFIFLTFFQTRTKLKIWLSQLRQCFRLRKEDTLRLFFDLSSRCQHILRNLSQHMLRFQNRWVMTLTDTNHHFGITWQPWASLVMICVAKCSKLIRMMLLVFNSLKVFSIIFVLSSEKGWTQTGGRVMNTRKRCAINLTPFAKI